MKFGIAASPGSSISAGVPNRDGSRGKRTLRGGAGRP
jgi:hypothetical protein